MASRVAKKPITIPDSVEVSYNESLIKVKGKKGSIEHQVHPKVVIEIDGNLIKIINNDGDSREKSALSGTTRATISNMVTGVSDGFEKRLILKGVGYRAQVKGKVLNLTLGLSHPVNFEVPADVTIETPSQTEIVIRSVNKQLLGQVAADIRAFRPPEPYKGKGIRYADEVIKIKETKK